MTNWHQRFLDTAIYISRYSKDRSTQVGGVLFDPITNAIVLSAYNGMVRGMDDTNDSFHERPLKYLLFEHAERKLCYFAARLGIRTEGLGMATTLYPCADCARAIVQSGIKDLVAPEPDWNHERWGESFKVSKMILKAGEVDVHLIEQKAKGELVILPVRG